MEPALRAAYGDKTGHSVDPRYRSLFVTFLVPINSFWRDILRCHDALIPIILLALESLFVV